MSTSTTTLLCKQCNFENEPERVYCHNCGAKLDRSLLPPEATKREDPVVVQERLRKMTNPRRGMGLRVVKNFISTVVIAALLAFLIQAGRPPEGIPELSQDQIFGAPMIVDDMQTSTESGGSHRMVFNADQVNAFLQYSLRAKDQSYVGIPVKFERMFVQMTEGEVRVFVQQSLVGLPIYANSAYNVEIKGDKLVATNLGGGIGRVKLPAFMGKGIDFVFAPIWKVTERYQKALAKMSAVAFHKDAVEITGPAVAVVP